jgi:hypothetical protein
MKTFLYLICLVVTLCFHSCLYSQENRSEHTEKIFLEMKNGWKSYLQHINKHEIEVVTTTKSIGETIDDTNICHILVNLPMLVREITFTDTSQSVQAFNSNYTFSLKKANEEWNVKDIMMPLETLGQTDQLIFPDFSQSSLKDSANHLAVFTAVKGLMLSHVDFLPVIADKPEFQLKSFRYFEENGIRLLNIEYTYEPTQFLSNQLVRGGNVILIPDLFFLIKSADVNYVEPGKQQRIHAKIFNEYEFTKSNFPYLKKHKRVINGIEYNNFTIETICTKFIPVENLPDSRFTLSHYGLPEPDFGERRTNRIRYIIIGIGILMMAIGAWRMIQKRRKRF